MRTDIQQVFLFRCNQLEERNFLEWRDARDLEHLRQTHVDPQLSMGDYRQNIHADGNPDLCFYGVWGGSEKLPDAQVLLDPPEKRLDLPSALVEIGNDQWGQLGVVGDGDNAFPELGIPIRDTTHRNRIQMAALGPAKADELVAAQPTSSIHGGGLDSAEVHVDLGSGDKEGQALIDGEQSIEVQISSIHDIVGSWLDGNMVQALEVVHLAVRDMDKRRDLTTDIEKGVELYRCLCPPESGPREQIQAKVDSCRVEGVDRLREIHSGDGGVAIHLLRRANQRRRQVGIDAPVPAGIGVGEVVPRRSAADSHVVEGVRLCRQAADEVAKAFSVGDLSKGHRQKLVVTGELLDLVVPCVAVDASLKLRVREKRHHLREHSLALVHQQPPECGGKLTSKGRTSNRFFENKSYVANYQSYAR